MENVPKFEDKLEPLANVLPSFLLRSKADNTVKSYLKSLGYWRIWTKSLPKIDVLPAKESHLALCIVSMIQIGTSFPTSTQMCYGVRWAHKLTGYKDPLKAPLVRAIYDSSKRILSKSTSKKEPITPFHLKKLARNRGGSRPVYKVCTNLSDFFPEKFFLEYFCKVQMIPDFMGSGFALQ